MNAPHPVLSPFQGVKFYCDALPGPPLRSSPGYHITGFQPDEQRAWKCEKKAGWTRFYERNTVAVMNNYITILATLLSSFLAYWFFGHCAAVARNGGPRGDGYETYQRAIHPIRFWIYVVVVGAIGIVLVSYAIYGFISVWKTIIAA